MKKVSKIIVAVFFGLILSNYTFGQTKWTVDKVHSNVLFTVTHMVISEVDGSFKVFDGSMTNTKEDFTDAQIDFTVDVASINTDNTMRDGHLKSDDFFNAEKYPKMIFKGTALKKIKDNKYELTGKLTIRDVTKDAKFDVTYGGTVKDGRGGFKAGFKAVGSINRIEYGLKWNKLTEAGGAMVGEDVAIRVQLELSQVK